jgi:hypothetical protein
LRKLDKRPKIRLLNNKFNNGPSLTILHLQLSTITQSNRLSLPTMLAMLNE